MEARYFVHKVSFTPESERRWRWCHSINVIEVPEDHPGLSKAKSKKLLLNLARQAAETGQATMHDFISKAESVADLKPGEISKEKFEQIRKEHSGLGNFWGGQSGGW